MIFWQFSMSDEEKEKFKKAFARMPSKAVSLLLSRLLKPISLPGEMDQESTQARLEMVHIAPCLFGFV